MKKSIIGIVALLILAVAFFCFCPCKPKIAIVNVNQIVRSYPKLTFAQRENNLKIGELSQWLDSIQKKIDAEKDKATKAKMIQDTQTLARQKKAAIQQEFAKKTAELNKEIEEIVMEVAKKNGCSIVFSTISVVTGGLDITEQVLKRFEAEKK